MCKESTGVAGVSVVEEFRLKTGLSTFAGWGRRYGLDALLLLVAVGLALPTLSYPLFRDQAHHFYVGRWWIEGLQPYRDAFDLKPPFIFALHAIGCALFSVPTWWIRLLDLLSVVGVSLLVAVSIPRRTERRRGEVGGVVLLGVLMYYTLFDYICSAQCESFMGFTLLLGWLAATRIRSWRRAAFLAGVLSAVAIGFKTPGLIPAIGIASLLSWRVWRETAERRSVVVAVGWYSLGGLAVALPVLLWFATHGALNDLIEAMTAYTLKYADDNPINAAGQRWRIHYFFVERAGAWTWLAGLLMVTGIVAVWRSRDVEGKRYAVGGLVMLLAAGLAVVAQGRYFAYHWVALFPFAMALMALGISQFLNWRPQIAGVVLPFMLMVTLALPGDRDYLEYLERWWRYQEGGITRDGFLNLFQSNWKFNARDSERLSSRVRDLARPGDRLSSLNREPNINVLADLRAPTAHPAWYPPMLTYKDGEWVKQRDEAIRRHEVRFVVVPTEDKRIIANMYRMGYRTVMVCNALTLLDGG